MSRVKVPTILLIAEVILCFALPAYFLFWGVLTAPVWFMGAARGAAFAIWNLASVVAGCLGIVGIIVFTRYVTSPDDGRRFPAIPYTAFAVAGLVAIWDTVTGTFTEWSLNWFVVVMAVLPTLCFVHFLVLALCRASRAHAR